jgi:hypothetical protein
MIRRFKQPRVTGSAVAGGLVLLFIVFILLSTMGLSSSGTSSGLSRQPSISRSQLAALRLGTRRQTVEDQFGKGGDALNYPETGVAVEPMTASCTYYAQAQTENVRAVIQLCFTHDRLSSKHAYPATPGAVLVA